MSRSPVIIPTHSKVIMSLYNYTIAIYIIQALQESSRATREVHRSPPVRTLTHSKVIMSLYNSHLCIQALHKSSGATGEVHRSPVVTPTHSKVIMSLYNSNLCIQQVIWSYRRSTQVTSGNSDTLKGNYVIV